MARQCGRRLFQILVVLGGAITVLVVLLPSEYEDSTASLITLSSFSAAAGVKEDPTRGETTSTAVLVEKDAATSVAVSATAPPLSMSSSTSTQDPDGVTLPLMERPRLEQLARAREQDQQPPGSSQEFCSLRLCRMYGSEAPVLFVSEHTDGAGHRMKNIMDGLAVAAKNSMNFGGVLACDSLVTEHGHDFHDLANRIVGGGGTRSHLFVKERPNFTRKFDSLWLLEQQRPELQPRALVHLPDTSQWSANGTGPSYFREELREALRHQLSLVPLVFAPGRPAVAMHLRRGDLAKKDPRVTPDEYYFRLVERIRSILPDADVHAWSSVQGYSGMYDRTFWSPSDFDGYRQRGIAVHLDGVDLMMPWAHLTHAHVLLTARSSFSYVPAMLNAHCVIYPGGSKALFPSWIDGQQLKGGPEDGLASCVRHEWN